MTIPRFWREIDQRYNLKGTRCTNCNRTFMPARSLCPTCRHESVGKLEPHAFSGEGTVESVTVVHQAPQGFDNQAPYHLAIVQLEEGPRVTAQIVDVPQGGNVAIGDRVRMVFRRINQDGEGGVIHYGYKFRVRDG